MSRDNILPLVEAAQQFEAIPRLRCVTAAELLAMTIGPREMVLTPILPVKGLAMLYAPRGVGKTYVALSIAHAVAGGGTVFGWSAPKPRRTLYLDGEMPAGAMQERLAAIMAGAMHEADPDYLRFMSADMQERCMPDLSSPAGQQELEEHLEGIEFLVIDNLSTLCRSGKENEAESWLPIQGWLLELRRRGISALLVHHAGKNGQQRGTSRREDVLDTVICLKKPTDYRTEDGARFEVVYEKARGFHGADAVPFEARLEVRNGTASWSVRTLEDVDLMRVAELAREGLSARNIEKETGISKSRVGRLTQKARDKGLVP